LGLEHEVWKNYLFYEKKKIWRHDIQSEEGFLLMNSIIKSAIPGMRLFSPLSSLRKLEVYETMLEHYPEILKHTTSCFFGRNCGKCMNCILYRNMRLFYEGKTISEENFLKELAINDTVAKETFEEFCFLFYYEYIKKYRFNKKYKQRLKEKYPHYFDKSLDDFFSKRIYKTKLLPRKFRWESFE
jgi:hypothetical protein